MPDARAFDCACHCSLPRTAANPLVDCPTEDAALLRDFPTYCRPNIWPGADLPELEGAFKALGRLIIEVGCLLAKHCDRFLAARGVHPSRSLHDTIAQSPCPKARLLHYFPPAPASSSGVDEQVPAQWCGWHLDHGSLTGLTSAMFLDAALGDVGAPPDPQAGLYARTRAGEVVKVSIPVDHIAYQVGEAMQVRRLVFLLSVLALLPQCNCVQAHSLLLQVVIGNKLTSAGALLGVAGTAAGAVGRPAARDAALRCGATARVGGWHQPQHICGVHAAAVG